MAQENKEFTAFNNSNGGVDFAFVDKPKQKVVDVATGQILTVTEGYELPKNLYTEAMAKQEQQIREEYNKSHSVGGVAISTLKELSNFGVNVGLGTVSQLAYEKIVQAPERAAIANLEGKPIYNALGEPVYLPEETRPELNEEQKKQINEEKTRLAYESYEAKRELVEALSFETENNPIGQFLGGTLGSVATVYAAAGWGMGGATAGLFGLNQYYDTRDYLLSQGVDYEEASKRAMIDGWLNFVIEKASLDRVLKIVKGGWAAPVKRVAAPAAIEGGTEVAQEKITQKIREPWDKRTPIEKDTDLLYAGAGGTLGGILGANFNYYKIYNMVSKDLQNKGYSKDVAEKAARDVALDLPSIIDEAAKEITMLSEDDIRRGQEFIEEAQQKGGEDADTYINILNTYKEAFKQGGLSEEDVYKNAESFALYHTSLFQAIRDKKSDLTFQEYSKEMATQGLRIIQEAIIDKKVDERVKEQLSWYGETSELTSEQLDEIERVSYNARTDIMREMGLLKEADTLYSRIGNQTAFTGDTIDINGVEKNVYNSDGAKIAQTEQSLRNFYNWFGNSKVVDKQGRPLLVYHGTDSEFSTFDISKIGKHGTSIGYGFYFASPKIAERYNKGYIMPEYLSIENPVDYDNSDIFDRNKTMIEDIADWFNDNYIESEDGHRLFVDNLNYILTKHKTDAGFINDILDFAEFSEIDKSRDEVYQDLFQKIKEVSTIDGFKQTTENGDIYVAFQPNQIKSPLNIGDYDINNRDTLQSRYNASYVPSKRLLTLFKGHNPQALVHELSHNFFIDYFRLTEQYGLEEKNKAIYDMLGKKSSKDFGEAEWETITEEFIKYLKTNEAPNIALQGLFDRAKNWIVETFFTMNKSDEPSPEVKEFFDNLVRSEYTEADATSLRMTPKTFKELIKSIKNGDEVSFQGVSRSDLKKLRRIMHLKYPRKGKNLAVEMRRDDMQIRADSELAKQLGYDSKVKNPIFDKNGTIDKIDELDEYLVEKGLLAPNLSETAENVADREDEIINIVSQAESVYSPAEQTYVDYSDYVAENQLRTQGLISEILKDNELGIKDIDEINQYIDKAIEMAKGTDSILVNKEAINFLIDGYKNAERLYNKTQKELEKTQTKLDNLKEAQKQLKDDLEANDKLVGEISKELTNAQDVIGIRQQMSDFIKSLPLNAKHRLKLMDKVKQVQKGDDFTKVFSDINKTFRTMWEQETKEILANNIDSIIKSTKPKERRKQKYNYDYNKLFEEFRKLNSLNKASAEKAYYAILDEMKEQLSDGYVDDGVKEEMDRVKRLLVSYKMNGRKDSSVTLMRELENSLFNLRQDAIEDKARTETEKAIKKKAEIDRAVNYIKGHKKVGKVLGFYLKNTNLYSNEAELFGKDWAKAHEMETVELEQSRLVREKTKKMIEKAKRIYGIQEDTGAKKVFKNSDKEFARIMNEKSQENYTLHGVNGSVKNMDRKISLLQIMDIYNTIKNKNSADIYSKLYETFDEEGNQISHQIDDLIDNLSPQDKMFADLVMADIQSLRDSENATYVKLYGIDMIKHENYYPRSAEKIEGELMDIKKFVVEDNTPSFFKERAKMSKLVPVNMWTKYQSRINDSIYMTHTFEKYKEHYDLIHNSDVKNAIESKYDSKRYTALNTSLKDLSLGGNHKTFDDMENFMSNMVSNWVVSKIALNDAVFVKQLLSMTNYIENMPVTDFMKYSMEMLTNPVKAFKFMNEFDGEYLNQRFTEGMQNEALAQIMANAERSVKKRDYIFQDYIDFVTLPVRLGDVGAIYLGGYARVRYLLDHGTPVDKARKIFEFESVRSQQSGLKASMAQFQKNTIFRFFTAFKNTQLQYQRKLFDGFIQWRRGEIDTEKYAKIVGNFAFLQAFMYQLATNVFSYIRDDDDDKEFEWSKDIAMQIITSPIAGVPLFGDVAQNVLKKQSYDIGVAGLQDVNKAIRLANKFGRDLTEGEFDAKTAEKAGAIMLQFIKPLPANIINNILTE